MSPPWGKTYYDKLVDRFAEVVAGLDKRLEDVVAGRVAPAIEDIEIGSGRSVRAGVMFFDVVGFSSRTSSAELERAKEALYVLDCVIPTMMGIVFDYEAYVEKNTGDGVMAIVGVGTDDASIARTTLQIAMTWLYTLNNLVNPWLGSQGIDPIEARVTIDMGSLILARIGMPKGTARHDRSFLTAIGSAANLASKLQDTAGADEIVTGDLIQRNAPPTWQPWFDDVTPSTGWTWTWVGGSTAGAPYRIWKYGGVWKQPV